MDKYLRDMVKELEVQTLYDEYTGDYIEAIEVEQIDDLICNVISIQKIKDKMEQLNKEIKNGDEIEAIFKIKQQQILQELIGDESNE